MHMTQASTKGDQNCYVSNRVKSPFKSIKPSKWFLSQLGLHLEWSMNNKTVQHRANCKAFKFGEVLNIKSREDAGSNGKYDYHILHSVKAFSPGAGEREFTAVVVSSIPPSVATAPTPTWRRGHFEVVDDNQISKMGVQQSLHAKGLAKKDPNVLPVP